MNPVSRPLTALVLLLLCGTLADAGIFGRHRRSRQPAPASNAAGYSCTAREISHAVPLTLEQKVLAVLREHRFTHGSIPSSEVGMDDEDNFTIGNDWSAVQKPLEKLFKRELGLEYKPQLVLVVQAVEGQPGRGRFRFTNPGDERVISVLSRALPCPDEMFDRELLLRGEFQNFAAAHFKVALLQNGQPHLPKIRSTILALLQSDKSMKELASKVNGYVKPIASQSNVKDKMEILTEWQAFAGNRNEKLYWRITVSLEKAEDDEWVLESVIRIGQRLKSQSFDQIKEITNTDRLNSFDSYLLYETDKNQVSRVTQKVVVSSGESLIAEEQRRLFGEFAPTLWGEVKKTILVE